MKYLSPLLLFGLNGVVILNGVGDGTRSAVFSPCCCWAKR